MTTLSMWNEKSDVLCFCDYSEYTIVVNDPKRSTYIMTNYNDYFDKLVELSVSGFKVPSYLLANE